MATTMQFLINYVNADNSYDLVPSNFIPVNLSTDYLIWTDSLADLMTSEPTQDEINAAAPVISDDADVEVTNVLLMDASHDIGGSYYTHKIIGVGENKRYVFVFSFDGATATEPQLEAWDSNLHTSFNKNVLGAGVALNSMIKGVCTTDALPGASWVGSALAGGTEVLLLNNGNGALGEPASGENNDLYANLKIVLPEDFATPGAETFVLTTRFTWA
jgi:hypothetical protein